MAERKRLWLRLDPAIHDAVARWAGDELRSVNAQTEFLLRRALVDAGRLPAGAGGLLRRGRRARNAEVSAATASRSEGEPEPSGRPPH